MAENTPTDSVRYTTLITALQGGWERTSYPFGTIDFRQNEVKITQGEGAVNPPKFQLYLIADGCPYDAEKEHTPTYLDFIVLNGDKACNAIKLRGDSLFLGVALGAEDIVYVRIE